MSENNTQVPEFCARSDDRKRIGAAMSDNGHQFPRPSVSKSTLLPVYLAIEICSYPPFEDICSSFRVG